MLVSMLFVSASNKSSLADLILKTSELSSQRKLTSTSAGSTAFSVQILFSLAISCFAVIGLVLLCVSCLLIAPCYQTTAHYR